MGLLCVQGEFFHLRFLDGVFVGLTIAQAIIKAFIDISIEKLRTFVNLNRAKEIFDKDRGCSSVGRAHGWHS